MGRGMYLFVLVSSCRSSRLDSTSRCSRFEAVDLLLQKQVTLDELCELFMRLGRSAITRQSFSEIARMCELVQPISGLSSSPELLFPQQQLLSLVDRRRL